MNYIERTFETEKFITLECMMVDEDGKVYEKFTHTTKKQSDVDFIDYLEHHRLRTLINK